MSEFRGFPADAWQFLTELTQEMNRDWFAANKERYERVWVEPLTALLGDVAAGLAKTYGPLKLGAPKVFRIYRDTRFATDKSPYKTHVAGRIATAATDITALYLHLSLDEEYVGSGAYFFEPKQLARWRKLVAADQAPVIETIGKLRKAGYQVGSFEPYKRVPAPYKAEHPRAEFLKMRGLTAQFPDIPRGLVGRPAFAKWVLDHARKTAPLPMWIAKTLKR
ncbi:MAG TPA: DUF2461 domain-containing protein [Kofleriaceae bacterium]